jgi:hypothetical protein
MFHLYDLACGVGSIKFVEMHFRDSVPHLSHNVTNKWGRVRPHGIG